MGLSAAAHHGFLLKWQPKRPQLVVPRGRRVPTLAQQANDRVLQAADPDAQGPFESVLRAIALDVPGLSVVSQHRIDADGAFVARVDLADLRLRMVLEADSFEFHGLPELMDKDCKRYDELVVEGWMVLRFSWSQVMTRGAWVRSVLERGAAVRERQLVLSA